MLDSSHFSETRWLGLETVRRQARFELHPGLGSPHSAPKKWPAKSLQAMKNKDLVGGLFQNYLLLAKAFLALWNRALACGKASSALATCGSPSRNTFCASS